MSKHYGLGRFIVDVFLTCITGGWYLAYLILKALHGRK